MFTKEVQYHDIGPVKRSISHIWDLLPILKFLWLHNHHTIYRITVHVSLHAAPLDPLDQRPMLKDLEEKVVLLAAGKWFAFGLQLDITPESLDAIKTPNGSNKEHCLEMFKCWLAKEQGCGSLPRTWSSVVHAVENSCGSEVSQELCKCLQQRTSQV